MHILQGFLLGIVLMVTTLTAHAWPTKPITIVVPFSVGGISDQLARSLIPDLESKLATTVVVKNVPGGNQTLALSHVNAQTPDDHTFILIDRGLAAGGVWARPDLVAQFRMVNIFGSVPFIFSGGADASLDEISTKTKSKRPMTLATTGSDSAQFLWIASLQNTPDMIPVPYKGGHPAMTDLAGGHVDYAVMSITLTHQFASTGKVKPLAISTSQRHPLMPDVPTFREIGWQGDTGGLWFGFMTPLSTKSEPVDRFNQTIETIIKDRRSLRRLEDQGLIFNYMNPKQSQGAFDRDVKTYQALREKLNIKQ